MSLASLSSQVTIPQHHLNLHSSPLSAFWYSAHNRMPTRLMWDLVSAMPLGVTPCLNVSWEIHLVRITPSSKEYKNFWGWLSCSGLTQSSVAVKPIFLPNLFIYLPISNSVVFLFVILEEDIKTAASYLKWFYDKFELNPVLLQSKCVSTETAELLHLFMRRALAKKCSDGTSVVQHNSVGLRWAHAGALLSIQYLENSTLSN